MSADTTLTIVGDLPADAELRFVSGGTGVASLTVESTPRHYDRDTGSWHDGEPLFLRCKRQSAETPRRPSPRAPG